MCSSGAFKNALKTRKMSLEVSDVEDEDRALLGARYVGKKPKVLYVKEPKRRTDDVSFFFFFFMITLLIHIYLD
jgi:hypothetical protein